MSLIGPSRQAAFFGPTVANGALRTWLDLQFAPPSERLRRQRWTGKQIAAATGVSPATVSRVLRRLGLNKLSALEPAELVRRYEREHPGQLIHLDIKKLLGNSSPGSLGGAGSTAVRPVVSSPQLRVRLAAVISSSALL